MKLKLKVNREKSQVAKADEVTTGFGHKLLPENLIPRSHAERSPLYTSFVMPAGKGVFVRPHGRTDSGNPCRNDADNRKICINMSAERGNHRGKLLAVKKLLLFANFEKQISLADI